MRILCTLLLLGITTFGLAQTRYSVQGQVVNQSGEPLFGASVVCRNNAGGTAVNSSGNFTLSLTTLPAYLEISFIGYKTHYLSLSEADFDSLNTAHLSVQLFPLTEQLATATVSGEAYEEFFTHNGYEVFDFMFVNDNILLLLRHKYQYTLLLTNDAQDSLAFLSLTKPAGGLVTDCLGQRYLLTSDSLLALSFADDAIQLLGGIDLEFYSRRIKPCVAANAHAMYYNFYQFNNQLMEVFQSPKAGGESKKIMEVVDWDNALSVEEYGIQAKQMLEGYNPISGLTLQGLGLFKEGFDRMAWFKHVLTQAGYNPLFAYRDGILLFNHLHDSVQRFDASGTIAESFPISYHKQKDFNKLLIEDYFTQERYAVFASGGMWRLAQISDKDFSAQEAVLIRNHDFPEGLKIRGGVAYFIDYDYNDYNRKKLYRQSLR